MLLTCRLLLTGHSALRTLTSASISLGALTIEAGRGYVQASQNRQPDMANNGIIPVDSIYSPVLKVSYRVEATRAGEFTNFDKLIVDVETKPSISPREAIASAGKTLVNLFGLANAGGRSTTRSVAGRSIPSAFSSRATPITK